jgi:putative aldouronate transport system substrate-binding protein
MSKKMTRFSILVSCIMVLSILLTACQPAATPAPVEPTKAAEPAQAEPTKAAEEPAAEPTKAAEPAKSELAPVTINWVLDGTGTPKDYEEVIAYLNNLPQVKALNVTVSLTWYDWGSFDQKTQLMFTSGEECDLVFTSSWANNYVNGAVNGNYVALDELLPKYAPKTWAEVSPVAWTMSKVNGKIYGVPNQQIWYNAWGWQIRKDIADKYGVTLDSINKYEDLTPLMEKILKDDPKLKYQIVQGSGPFVAGTMGYDAMPGGFGAIKQGDSARKIVNLNAEPIYAERVKLAREWVKAGYAPQEVTDYATADAARKNGFFPIKLHVEKPGFAGEDKMIYGSDWIGKPLEQPVLGYVLPSMTGVCATSKNPERALMFYDLMYSDPEVYNVIANGLENKHWVWVDKAKKVIGFPEGLDPKNSGWNINTDWMIGNVFISPYKNPNQVGAWDETRKVNQAAVLPMMGPFVFDPTPVQAELAALTTIDKQYGEPLFSGLIDPADPTKGIDAWIKAEKDAGVDKVIAEEQKQLDAFIAANADIFK